MSGQQIGTGVGFIAGFFLPGGPQVWAGIGGFIGGAISPTQIEGPRLTDGMGVTAQDGVPNTWGFGTFSTGVNVINAFDLREIREEDDGKGSGTEQVTYSYTRSFALGICRAVRNADGTYSDIAGIVRVSHNGKDIYNVLPDATAEQTANNDKFLEQFTIYLGGETQLPDPTLESYMGEDNVSAYRGQVYMVGTDVDQTEARGAMGTWEVVVAMGGEIAATMAIAIGNINTPTNRQAITRSFDGVSWPTSTDPVSPSISATNISPSGDLFYIWDINNVYYTDGLGGQPVGPVTTLNGSATQKQAYSRTDILLIPNGSTYKHIDSDGTINTFSHGLPSANGLRNIAVNDTAAVGFYQDSFDGSARAGICSASGIGTWTQGAEIPIYNADNHYLSCNDTHFGIGGQTSNISPEPRVCASASPQTSWYGVTLSGSSGSNVQFLTPGEDGRWVALVDNGEIWWSDDNWLTANQSATSLPETPSGCAWNGVNFIAGCGPSGDAQIYTSPDGDDWTLQSQPLTSITILSARPPSIDSIEPESVPLSTIISEVCRRSGLSATDIDASALTQLVKGFKIATETSGEAIVASLMPGYFFDAAEWDDKIRFINRGGAPVFDLVVDDLVERDGPLIEETEVQEVELLRKAIVHTMDPDAGYVETPQSWERRAATVAATGEQTLQLPVVMGRDEARQVANKRIKVAWTEIRRFLFELPYTRPELTPTDCGTITDRSGRQQRIRLEQMTEDSGIIEVREAKLDRQSAYTSNVMGVQHGQRPTTTPQPPGPTFFWAGNLPSLRTSDNTPGMYIAAAGYQRGWHGASIFLSTDSGASFQRIMEWPTASRMGVLTGQIDEDDEPIPVFMNSGTLATVTDDQLANRANGFSITSADSNGVASEIGQFKTATLTGTQEYDLTDTLRGALGTQATGHYIGDPFVMLGSTVFLPIDISHAGRTLIFKAVSYGETLDETAEYPVVFSPLFTSVVIEQYTDDTGEGYTDDADNPYYYETTA